ncbi:MAG: LacI family DNA-binding transcriptional regulator [Candidatus Acidiferrum sp.]
MTAPVTMRQIAKRADVSIGTVSHVVNDSARVRPKLRERVLEVIRSLGFQPSALAQGLRTNRTRILGMRCCTRRWIVRRALAWPGYLKKG